MKSSSLLATVLLIAPTGLSFAQIGTFSPQISVLNNLNNTAGTNGIGIAAGDTASIFFTRSVNVWSDTWWQWTMGTDNKLRLGFSSVPQLTFQNGAVGLGTDNPENRLHVGDGDIRISRASGSWGPNLLLDGTKVGSGGVLWGIGSTTSSDLAGAGRLAFLANGNQHVVITSSGNVGIGTTAPVAKLDVAGSAHLGVGTQNVSNTVNGLSVQDESGTTVALAVGRSTGRSAGLVWYDSETTGSAVLYTFGNAAPLTISAATVNVVAGGNTSLFAASNGNVGIGTTNPTHKLAVNGTIKAREVIVETTGWSDYVFADDYELAPLAEVEAHIKASKHLPGIPSAAQIAEQGVSIGDMQARLLAKIEELTLHVIAQEKRTADQDKEIATLRAQVSAYHTLSP